MLKLLIQFWKEKQRSKFWQNSVILNILLGIFGLVLLSNVLLISLFSDKLIYEIFTDRDVVKIFSGLLFYYFSFDLIIRFLFQQLPVLSIHPYLTLPIYKSTLSNFFLIKSTSSYFNIFAFFLILPFFVKVVCYTHSTQFCLIWIITFFSFILNNNFLNFLLKKYFPKRPLLIFILLILIGLSLFLDLKNIVPCASYFSTVIIYLANTCYLVVIPISISISIYYLAYFLLRKNLYIEDIKTETQIKAKEILFLNRFGRIGGLLRIEIKMILRNKRPKSMLYLSVFFLAYGFILYNGKNLENYMILTMIGLLMTSIFSLLYGQYLFSWESSFFDCYLVYNISAYDYIRSKYLLLMISSILSYFLSLPYVLISYKIIIVNIPLLFYNIGISSILLIFFCTFNSSRIDLGKSQFMNYQGTGLNQFLLIIPIMGVPIPVYLIFKSFGLSQYYFYVLGMMGLIGIIFNKYFIHMMTSQFIKRKYQMALGFRQK